MNAFFFPQSKLAKLRAAFLLCSIVGLLFATKNVMERQLLGEPARWTKALWWQFTEWYTWGLLSFVVFWICRINYKPAGRWFRYFLIHFFSGLVISIIQATVCTVAGMIEAWVRDWPLTPVGEPYSFVHALTWTVVNHLHFNFLVYAALVVLWHAARYYKDLREREVKAAELEARLAQAQLHALKAQLRPHFLFNTLNAIAELVHDDPATAERLILSLSDLLRLSLKSSKTQEVSLQQEVEFLKKYVEIEQMRLGNRLRVDWNIQRDTWSAKVPNLILQPLVENAIKHGIAPYAKAGRIIVSSCLSNGFLELQVRDNGPGMTSEFPNQSQSGIGLENIRLRLHQLYGKQQRFGLANDEGLVVCLSLPFIRCNETGELVDVR